VAETVQQLHEAQTLATTTPVTTDTPLECAVKLRFSQAFPSEFRITSPAVFKEPLYLPLYILFERRLMQEEDIRTPDGTPGPLLLGFQQAAIQVFSSSAHPATEWVRRMINDELTH